MNIKEKLQRFVDLENYSGEIVSVKFNEQRNEAEAQNLKFRIVEERKNEDLGIEIVDVVVMDEETEVIELTATKDEADDEWVVFVAGAFRTAFCPIIASIKATALVY